MPKDAHPLRTLAGVLAFALLVAGGTWWGISRARRAAPPAPEVVSVLRVEPGAAAASHRYSFTLGRPSRITVRLANPQGVAGTLRVGPPQVAKESSFDTADPKWSRSFELREADSGEFTWLDLTVGTRVINVDFASAAPLGLEVVTAPPK